VEAGPRYYEGAIPEVMLAAEVITIVAIWHVITAAGRDGRMPILVVVVATWRIRAVIFRWVEVANADSFSLSGDMLCRELRPPLTWKFWGWSHDTIFVAGPEGGRFGTFREWRYACASRSRSALLWDCRNAIFCT